VINIEECNYYEGTNSPFSNNVILGNLESIKRRVTRKNLASVILIDGGLGKGKTTLAVQAASCLQGSQIDLQKQIALGGEQLQEKLLMCHEEGLPVLIYDEASDFNRRGALTKFNAELNRVFDVCRAFKIIIIMVLPSIKVLDNDLFNKGIVRCLFHVADKGWKCSLVWAYSAYRLAYLINALKDTKKNPVPGKCYITATHHNFDFRVYNLSKKRSAELERVSTKSKLVVLQNSVVRLNGLVNMKQMAENIGMSKGWVMMTVRKHKIKHEKLYKKIKYFNSEQQRKIESLIQNKNYSTKV